ncbi:MAG: tetratricopeptide repeat protein [Acidobacteria bacterium]|nr:tetratricopeptide repeat protein [Acidobacteriota bacterium]NIM60752.1 tetratricopeptide repeat protein [Acidobacteriota bacterium]NIO57965.1 tetratricopeptide repeat protein [Acidobacteriota bacterium]NIQ28970.1 tetratricopeptide repeat protein [Acidobacteriota bacterium]NIQ83442.1 tetratricopeptide repeat protein [Acidobacteriota bacterium]
MHVQKGAVLYLAKRYDNARQEFLLAKKIAGAAGDFHHVIRAEGNIGSCYAKLGKNREATRRFIRCIELARKHNDPVKEASWLVELGCQYFKARDLSEAQQCGRSALIIARRLENPGIVFRAEWLLHRVARLEDPSDADARRLSYLKRLYVRVKNHKDLEELDEFRVQILGGGDEHA